MKRQYAGTILLLIKGECEFLILTSPENQKEGGTPFQNRCTIRLVAKKKKTTHTNTIQQHSYKEQEMPPTIHRWRTHVDDSSYEFSAERVPT